MSRCARQCGGGRSSVANTFHLKSLSACGNKYEKLICVWKIKMKNLSACRNKYEKLICGSFFWIQSLNMGIFANLPQENIFLLNIKVGKKWRLWSRMMMGNRWGKWCRDWNMKHDPTNHPPTCPFSHFSHSAKLRDSIKHSIFIGKWKGAMNLKWNATRGKDTF